MNWAQTELYKNLWTRNNVLKVRQLGISTFIAILLLDLCLFTPNFNAGIVDKTLDDAKGKMRKIKSAFNWLLTPPARVHDDHVQDAEAREKIEKFSMAIARTGGGEFKTAAAISDTMIKFSNGSFLRIGTNLIGSTMQFLHVSEFGYIAKNFPKRAVDIVTGAFETVGSDGVIVMESTHQGGKYGDNYRMTKAAMENVGKPLGTNDFKFFFFPWWKQKEYSSAEAAVDTSELADYWRELEENDIQLTDNQKVWYLSKYKTLGFSVKREYPSTPEEAFLNQVDGSIYGAAISRLRAAGRISAQFENQFDSPFYVSWDLGLQDNTSLWLIQPGGDGRYYIHDFFSANDLTLDYYINKVREWESVYNMRVYTHILPHDGNTRSNFDKLNFNQRLTNAGFKVVVLPRTRNLWASIFATRDLLRHCVFHERCNNIIEVAGREYMSGVDCLEQYTKRGDRGKEEPVHDEASHGADAFRYFVEAVSNGYVGKEKITSSEEDDTESSLYWGGVTKRKAKSRVIGMPEWLDDY